MTATTSIQHPACPKDGSATTMAAPDKSALTLYPTVEKIMGVADFNKVEVYKDAKMLQQISPYLLPAGFFATLPQTICRAPDDFRFQFISFPCLVENPASTIQQQVRVFVLDPGKVEYYKGWWGVVEIPESVPGAAKGGEGDNVMGSEAQEMLATLVAKKVYQYKWRNTLGETVLHLKRIAETAADALATNANSPAASGKAFCVLL